MGRGVAGVGALLCAGAFALGLAALFSPKWVQNPTGQQFGLLRFCDAGGTCNFYGDETWPDKTIKSAVGVWVGGVCLNLAATVVGFYASFLTCCCEGCQERNLGFLGGFLAFVCFILYWVGLMMFASKYDALGNSACGSSSGGFALGNCSGEWGLWVAVACVVTSFLTIIGLIPNWAWLASCCGFTAKEGEKEHESLIDGKRGRKKGQAEVQVEMGTARQGPTVVTGGLDRTTMEAGYGGGAGKGDLKGDIQHSNPSPTVNAPIPTQNRNQNPPPPGPSTSRPTGPPQAAAPTQQTQQKPPASANYAAQTAAPRQSNTTSAQSQYAPPPTTTQQQQPHQNYSTQNSSISSTFAGVAASQKSLQGNGSGGTAVGAAAALAGVAGVVGVGIAAANQNAKNAQSSQTVEKKATGGSGSAGGSTAAAAGGAIKGAPASSMPDAVALGYDNPAMARQTPTQKPTQPSKNPPVTATSSTGAGAHPPTRTTTGPGGVGAAAAAGGEKPDSTQQKLNSKGSDGLQAMASKKSLKPSGSGLKTQVDPEHDAKLAAMAAAAAAAATAAAMAEADRRYKALEEQQRKQQEDMQRMVAEQEKARVELERQRREIEERQEQLRKEKEMADMQQTKAELERQQKELYQQQEELKRKQEEQEQTRLALEREKEEMVSKQKAQQEALELEEKERLRRDAIEKAEKLAAEATATAAVAEKERGGEGEGEGEGEGGGKREKEGGGVDVGEGEKGKGEGEGEGEEDWQECQESQEPYARAFEVREAMRTKEGPLPRNLIAKLQVLGSGAFGKVYAGALFYNNMNSPIAIKELIDADPAEVQKLLAEAELMRKLKHDNIVMCIGTSEGEPLMIVLELLTIGDLYTYLTSRKQKNIAVALDHRFWFGQQIARGMAYLASMGIVHRDLAARNVMLSDPISTTYGYPIVKVSDFGLSRPMDTDKDYYQSSGEGKVPIAWLPPETLSNLKYGEASDVWAYGVTMWEIFTNCQRPYGGILFYQLTLKLGAGYRLQQPSLASDDTYGVMMACWAQDPHQRPKFVALADRMADMFISEAKEPYAKIVEETDVIIVPDGTEGSTTEPTPSNLLTEQVIGSVATEISEAVSEKSAEELIDDGGYDEIVDNRAKVGKDGEGGEFPNLGVAVGGVGTERYSIISNDEGEEVGEGDDGYVGFSSDRVDVRTEPEGGLNVTPSGYLNLNSAENLNPAPPAPLHESASEKGSQTGGSYEELTGFDQVKDMFPSVKRAGSIGDGNEDETDNEGDGYDFPQGYDNLVQKQGIDVPASAPNLSKNPENDEKSPALITPATIAEIPVSDSARSVESDSSSANQKTSLPKPIVAVPSSAPDLLREHGEEATKPLLQTPATVAEISSSGTKNEPENTEHSDTNDGIYDNTYAVASTAAAAAGGAVKSQPSGDAELFEAYDNPALLQRSNVSCDPQNNQSGDAVTDSAFEAYDNPALVARQPSTNNQSNAVPSGATPSQSNDADFDSYDNPALVARQPNNNQSTSAAKTAPPARPPKSGGLLSGGSASGATTPNMETYDNVTLNTNTPVGGNVDMVGLGVPPPRPPKSGSLRSDTHVTNE